MARLDDHIAEVRDPVVRQKLADALADMKRRQRFGLVFEEHVPETTALLSFPISVGAVVQRRSDMDGKALYRVTEMNGRKATVEPLDAGDGEAVPLKDLMVVKRFGDPIYPALTPVGSVRRGGDKPHHAVINGENFHALQLFTYLYEGLVDCIYIDPPYNSGARDWKYNNHYVDDNDNWRHSKWLSMIEKRLQLAQRLLNPKDSVLIVTIDEKEYLRLGLLLERVFVGCNIQMTTIVINPKGTARYNEFSRVEEYAFFVFIGGAKLQSIGRDMLTNRDYEAETDVRWRGLARTGRKGLRSNNPGSWYPIFLNKSDFSLHSIGDAIPKDVDESTVKVPPGTIAVWPPKKDGHQYSWSTVSETLRSIHAKGGFKIGRVNHEKASYPFYYLSTGAFEKIAKGEVLVVGRGSANELILQYAEGSKSAAPRSVWNQVAHDAGSHGTSLLQRFIPGRKFPFPKSLYAVEDSLRFFVQDKPDALILDFFGGSGTTTHAVARLNKQDGGRRRSILVTNNEVAAAEAELLRQRGLEPGDAEWEALGIFEHVTLPRVTAAFTGKKPDGTPIEGDYKFADEFPMADGFEENVEFFRLEYLDADDVDLGTQFDAILPSLWLAAGGIGDREEGASGKAFTMPEGSTYAVLFREGSFGKFRKALEARPEVTHVWLVTDSEDAYAEMRTALPSRVKSSMLYRDYLRNVRINTRQNV
jgi:adenine-specific DNA-methyltransferase